MGELVGVERLGPGERVREHSPVEGDVRTGALKTAPFDVVHAHQVLHYLDDPVAALAAMAKMTKSGGVVAARDGDYASMVWAPDDPRLDRWLSIYRAVLAADPAQADALHLLGVLTLDKGDRATALTLLVEAAARLPGFAIVHFNLANARLANGQLDQAVA